MAEKKETTGLTVLQGKLLKIQGDLKAPKNRYNGFGKYNYRDAEGILEAVKPLLAREEILMVMSDDIETYNGRNYVVATVQLQLGESAITVYARAREEEAKKGMDGSQVTGASSSYARKYALNGLFLIDDSQDSDTSNDGSEGSKKAKKQESVPDKEPEVKNAIVVGTPAFEACSKWLSESTEMIFDAIGQLRTKYEISPDVETALVAKATELKTAK